MFHLTDKYVYVYYALCSDNSLSMFPVIQALAGPHFYTWGDHGGILMAIAQGGPTTHLK